MNLPFKGWGAAIPVYVTRPDADGRIADWSVSFGFVVVPVMVAWANIVGWGTYGLYALASTIL